ncbi:MAG: cation:proton antiporter [Armatimonadota bacterium]|nr:MAG: cation:proton antiporter [Armatimonadota bacterium]
MPEVSETGRVLFDLLLLFVSAKLAGEILLRLRQPVVAGEIIAGMIIGPHLLGLVGESPFLDTFAELSVVFLLFIVGMEVEPRELLRVGGIATGVAIMGMVLPFGLGLGFMELLDRPLAEGLFVGAALTATSVGITARVLQDMGQLGSRVARVILGAAVLDDIGGMLVLAVVAGITAGAVVSGSQIMILLGTAVGALAVAFMLARSAVQRFRPRLYSFTRANNERVLFAVAVALCLAFAALAEVIHLAAIIGAFFAGVIFAELREAPQLRRAMEPIYDFMVPIFFVMMGAKVDLRLLLSPQVLQVGLIITGLAILGKVVGCALAAYRMKLRDALAVGVGMAPRGEVGIVIALIGLQRGVISNDVYSQVIFMSVLTSVFAPSLLRVLLMPPAEPVESGAAPEPTN